MDDLTGKVDSAGPPDGQLAAAEWNQLAAEIEWLRAYGGAAATNADLEQVGKSVGQLASTADFYTCTGTANAAILSIIGRPGATGFFTGLRIRWKPSLANTGATTVNVNGLGVKDLKRPDGSVLQANDLLTTRLAEAYYDNAGEFRLTPGALPVSTAALPSGYISGLVFTPSAADLTHDLSFPVGQCRDTTNGANLVLSGALVKSFDGASIALGTGQCGFPTVSLTRAAATWYRVFIVGHTDGRVDFGFDTSATAANLRADLVSIDVAGWTYYRQLGWVLTAGSTDFVPFVQYAAKPGVFHWVQHETTVGIGASLATSRTARSLATVCPPGAVATVEVLVEPPSGASGGTRRHALLTDKNQADFNPSAALHTITHKNNGGNNGAWNLAGVVEIEVDASSEIYERWDSAGNWERTLRVPRFSFAR